MFLQQLKTGDKFLFSRKQAVRTTTWTNGEVTKLQELGRGTKGFVMKANASSVRVILTYRDKDRQAEECSMKFDRNREVEVEKI
jgi:hypothetical protein